MSKNLFYFLISISMLFWGASWVSAKVLTSYINEYELIFLRMGISSLAMLPLFLFYKKDNYLPNKKSLALITLASFIYIFYSVIFFIGVDFGTAGLGGALVTTLIPINTFVIVSLLNRKHIKLKYSFALILGAFGTLTILNIWSFNINEIFSKENIYFILASFIWVFLSITNSKEEKLNPLFFTFYIYTLCAIVVYIFFIEDGFLSKITNFDYIFWINTFIISILSTTFATSVYFIGITKLGTKEVSSFIFLVPSSALIFSSIFLDESITFNTILGTICTIIAIYILNNINILKFFRKKKSKEVI